MSIPLPEINGQAMALGQALKQDGEKTPECLIGSSNEA
jgi:hypothetical protein